MTVVIDFVKILNHHCVNQLLNEMYYTSWGCDWSNLTNSQRNYWVGLPNREVTFCRGNTYSHSSQKSLRHISYNDTNQEDDSIQPVVLQDEGDNEERHSEEYSHSSDNVDKVSNLTSNGCLSNLQSRSEVSNTSHHSPVSSRDYTSPACTLHSISREEGDVPRLEWVLMSTFW